MDPILIVIILVILAVIIGTGIYGYNEYNKLKEIVEDNEAETSDYKRQAEEDAKKLIDSLANEKINTIKAIKDAQTLIEEKRIKDAQIAAISKSKEEIEALLEQKNKDEIALEEAKKKYIEEQVNLLMLKENITREEALAQIDKMGLRWSKDTDGNIIWTISNYMRYIYDGVVSIVWNQHPNKCFDAVNPVKGGSNNTHLWDCANDNLNQFFVYDKNTNQLRWDKDKDICVTKQGDKERIRMSDCAKPEQKELYDKQIFAYNDDDQIYSLKEPTQCLGVLDGKTANGSSIISGICDKDNQYQKFKIKKKLQIVT